MDKLKQVLETLLLLAIFLTILLLFGPIIIMIAIVGKIKWREDNILDISHIGRSQRLALGTVGLVAWFVLYGALFGVLIPTPIVVSILMPASVSIDQMETPFIWQTHQDNKGSVISIRAAPGMKNNAIEIGYNLKPEGWVTIAKEMEPSVLVGTSKIRFSYAGYGAPNTIELKLIYKDGKIFSAEWSGITDTNGKWKILEASYDQLACWIGTGCTLGEKIDIRRVEKIDFAVSNRSGNAPGIGVVRIDNVDALK